jgi:ABC-2 type transport system ATP-binding protein
MTETPTIECHTLSKTFSTYEKGAGLAGSLRSFFHRTYRSVAAVEDFSFRAEPAQIIGLLGPNGAGKTTIMKMLTGIIVPTSGTVRVLGHTPCERALSLRKKISLVMGQKSQLWWDIPAFDSLQLLGHYYEVEPTIFRTRVNELAEMLLVEHLLHIHVRKLSLGERMKLELMASLLHEPEVLFLDEPTIGLDLVAQRNIRKFLLEYQRARGTTIILTSHYMGDVHALADRIVLLLDGRNRFDGSLQEFETLFGHEKYVQIEFEQPVEQSALIWKDLHPVWESDGLRVELRIGAEQFRELIHGITAHFPVSNISSEKLPIERVMTSILENPHLLSSSSQDETSSEQG